MRFITTFLTACAICFPAVATAEITSLLTKPSVALWLDPNDPSTLGLDANNRVMWWRDKSANNLLFVAPLEEDRPLYSPNAFGTGRPGVVFDGTDYLQVLATNWAVTSKGEYHTHVRFEQFVFGTENFILGTSSTTSDMEYFLFGILNPPYGTPAYTGEPRQLIRVRDQVGSGINASISVYSGTTPTIVEGANHVLTYRAFGTGAVASWNLAVDGVFGSTDYFSNATGLDTWLDDVSPRHNVVLGAFGTQQGVQGRQKFTLGNQILYSDNLTLAESAELDNWLATSSVVPEPSSAVLLALLGIFGLCVCKKRYS